MVLVIVVVVVISSNHSNNSSTNKSNHSSNNSKTNNNKTTMGLRPGSLLNSFQTTLTPNPEKSYGGFYFVCDHDKHRNA